MCKINPQTPNTYRIIILIPRTGKNTPFLSLFGFIKRFSLIIRRVNLYYSCIFKRKNARFS